jgi:hypothetical protein
LKRSGFAGIRVQDLAVSLGRAALYSSVYRIASQGVHAQDALDHVLLKDGENEDSQCMAAPGTEYTASILRVASIIMVMIVEASDKRFGFGLEEKVNELKVKVGRMRNAFPA